MDKDEALKLALATLRDYVNEHGPWSDDCGVQYVLRLCKKALAQPEIESVDSDEIASAYMADQLGEFVQTAGAFPKAKVDSRLWNQVMVFAPKQSEPLTDEMVKQMKENCTSMEMRGAFANGWLSAEAAHGIKE